MVFTIFTKLCKHHHYLISGHSHRSKRNPIPISSDVPLFPPILFLAATNLLSISMDLPLPYILYKWNQINYGSCVWLPSLSITYSKAIRVVVCIGALFLFMVKQYFIVWIHHNWFIHLPADGYVGYFHFLIIINNATLNINAHIFV